eukprot:Rmarinus@m.18617
MDGQACKAGIPLEHPFLKVPFEGVNRVFRNSQKQIERDLSSVVKAINEFNPSSMSRENASSSIDKLFSKLQGLKRKLDDFNGEEQMYMKRMKKRIAHLKEAESATDSTTHIHYNTIRLNRLLVDYLMREGFYESAIMLANHCDIADFVDTDVFLNSQRVLDSLERHECQPALAWCTENKSKLKKIQSSLEFKLRLQEFIVLIQQRQCKQAVQYAQKHFASSFSTNSAEIERAMGALAFPAATKCERYAHLFSDDKWDELIDLFKHDNYLLHSLTLEPVLEITLAAGFSALKTPHCYEAESKNTNCPVCQPKVSELVAALPYSHHLQSSLVCRLTGLVMDEDNPPLVLPNGSVYCKKAMSEMADRSGGMVTCPRTKQTFKFSSLRKAFIS